MLSKRLGHAIKQREKKKKERVEKVRWERERNEHVFY
jgi:hypothetical protein